MHKNLPLAVRSAIQDSKLVSDESPSIDIFDLDHLEARIKDLNEAFSEDFILNAYAMKVNPIRGVLRSVLTGGLGVECASLPEAKHALQMGFPPQKIIYGGLCKTKVGKNEQEDLMLTPLQTRLLSTIPVRFGVHHLGRDDGELGQRPRAPCRGSNLKEEQGVRAQRQVRFASQSCGGSGGECTDIHGNQVLQVRGPDHRRKCKVFIGMKN